MKRNSNQAIALAAVMAACLGSLTACNEFNKQEQKAEETAVKKDTKCDDIAAAKSALDDESMRLSLNMSKIDAVLIDYLSQPLLISEEMNFVQAEALNKSESEIKAHEAKIADYYAMVAPIADTDVEGCSDGSTLHVLSLDAQNIERTELEGFVAKNLSKVAINKSDLEEVATDSSVD